MTEGQAKNDPLGLGVFEKFANLKKEFIKYCKLFESRLRSNVNSHSVFAKVKELSTDIFIPGFIVDASAKGKQRLGPLKFNLQFLEHHKDQLLELHQELIKTNYGSQTNAALQNFKTLLKLEISLLMGCDIKWGGESEVAAPAAAAGTVLGASAVNDDDDDSSDERGGEGGAGPAGPARGKDRAAAPAVNGGGGTAPAAPAVDGRGGVALLAYPQPHVPGTICMARHLSHRAQRCRTKDMADYGPSRIQR